ncbi:hypothetical protein DPMN_138607 [Dreissena polymorpha]|uniref:Uncharacterized protein n=1 Tax=Dreissena polymorpha TaxID=45954 RepID=A0A9D4G496_DREPO|nr:hypothetical protein DPMN_138607 [Dreissena polymorpha]
MTTSTTHASTWLPGEWKHPSVSSYKAKVQTQSVTSAARTVRTDNGHMRPLEAFIRLALTHASCRLITVVILHQVVSCRQAVPDVSCR